MSNLSRYENAKIYKIVDNTNGDIYVGSTCKKLCQRIAQHRQDYKRYLKGKFGKLTSFKILENNDYSIVLIENVENCKSKEELLKRERFYIESLNCVNKTIPKRTNHEYYLDNKEKVKEYQEANKTKIKEYMKTYNIKYNEVNKETIREKKQKDCMCQICHCTYKLTHKSDHEKTKKHQNNLKQLN
jgi:hypothetical protein